MVNCAVTGCKNYDRKGSDIKYFRNEIQDRVNKDALIYIAGYVAHKFRGKYDDLGVATKNIEVNRASHCWLNFISRGNLLYPNENLLRVTTVLECEFKEMHGTSLTDDKHLFTNLCNRTIAKLTNDLKATIPQEVILCLARTRTYIRLRDLNRRISFENCRKRLDKKMSKFLNSKK